jgi:hypothetical protein
LPPGEYHFFGSGGVGGICPHSGKVPFVVIAAEDDDVSANVPATPLPEGEPINISPDLISADTPIVILADGVSLETSIESR